MKKFLTVTLLIFFGVTIPLLMVEAGFRVTAWHQSQSLADALAASEHSDVSVDNPSLKGLVRQSIDPKIVFELKPNITGRFLNEPLRTNSFGMRYPEIPQAKPEGTVRIALIGDSIAFGWGVKEEERYSSLLEKTLSEKFGKKVELLNFGVPGYNSAMEAEVVEKKIEAFAPDLLLLHFVNNDDSAPYFLSESESPFSVKTSFLLNFIRDHVRTLRGAKTQGGDANMVGFGSLPQETQNEVMREYAWMVGPGAVQNALDQIGQWCQDRKIKSYIVYGSLRPGQFSILRRAAKTHAMVMVNIRKYVESYFKEKGIVSKADRFKDLTLNTADPHPNANGHAIYARALQDAIAAP